MRVEFLPPYSPDYNPVELAFDDIKAYFRRNGEALCHALRGDDGSRLGGEAITFLWNAIYSITPDDAAGFFNKCGYKVPGHA
ncbi:hypothetical protein OH77DRAFT_1397691 [Trametes cingulata]|nr:hypothetical protein OH77DRAFT_1397691 [Trametes cingulata]